MFKFSLDIVPLIAAKINGTIKESVQSLLTVGCLDNMMELSYLYVSVSYRKRRKAGKGIRTVKRGSVFPAFA